MLFYKNLFNFRKTRRGYVHSPSWKLFSSEPLNCGSSSFSISLTHSAYVKSEESEDAGVGHAHIKGCILDIISTSYTWNFVPYPVLDFSFEDSWYGCFSNMARKIILQLGTNVSSLLYFEFFMEQVR